MRSGFSLVLCAVGVFSGLLAGCGGSGGDGGGGTTPPPVTNNPPPPAPPPPPPPPPPPTIGAGGGTVTEIGGASVIFPAGAVSNDTTFRIAVDSTGAPPLPAGLGGTGSVYAITPHGGNFAKPV